MSDEENFSEGEDFEDGDLETSTIFFKPSYVIVAIDTHPSMFKHNENGQLPFRNCLESCLRILDSLMFVKDSKSWNSFAVLLAKNEPNFINFGDNIIDSIKLLQSLLKQSDQKLESEYKRQGDFNLAEFLLQCKKAFHDIKAVFHQRILVFITNDDNPVDNAQSKFAAINEVKSFEASEIKLEIIPTNVRFDFTLLYNEMFAQMTDDRKEEICTDVDGLEQKLSSVVLPKLYKRKVNFYPFQGDVTTYLTCYDFKTVKTPSLLNTKVTVEGKEVITKPPSPSVDLPTYDLISTANGNMNVTFDIMDKNKMLNVSLPRGYTLICIAKSVVKPIYNISKNHILQENFKQETKYFKMFWDYCHANERVLICVIKYKQPGKITYCQMSPIMLGDVPSFLCKEIPSADDIQLPPNEHSVKVENVEEKCEAVRNLVSKLTTDFHPDMIPDPKYRKKLGHVKAKLLDEPLHDNIEVFDKSSIDGRIREEIEQIKNVFDITADPNGGGKRKRSEKTAKAAPRKKKN